MNARLPPEADPDAIERAMLALARAAATAGCGPFTRPAKTPNPALTSELSMVDRFPGRMSLMRAEFALMMHDTRLVA